MNENGNRYALAALKERRASIDGEMRECERRLRYLRKMLGNLDAVLGLFDPDGNPKAIKAKRSYRHVKLFAAGQLSRLILGALRTGARPMATVEVIQAVIAELGYGDDAAGGMSTRIRGGLIYLCKTRRLVVKEGDRETTRWVIAP
jgi:hypothetical protein